MTIPNTYNAWYVQALYEQFVRNPGSVDEAWRRIFEAEGGWLPDGDGASGNGAGAAAAAPAEARLDQLQAARAAGELMDAYRLNGHWAARIDPLGSPRPGHPMLHPKFHGITEEQLATVPAAVLGVRDGARTAADVIASLREVYTGPVGYEYEHLQEPERREWLREQIEGKLHRRAVGADEKRRLLRRLTEVEAFEQFIHRAYLGAKRFSVEGNDMLIPMLDLAVESAAASGAREVVFGMAHRGRLNTLVHVLGRPYAAILGEFEGRHAMTGGTGDVKYHLGAEGTYATQSGEPLTVTLAPNPSHLEFVDPVVEGMARAKQSRLDTRELVRDESLVLPVLMHGDAAFAGQGVVAETLNMAELNGYRTGGTLHIIVNNQVGFTTNPGEGRSTGYASDVARGFNIPVFHVNADVPEACLAVTRLALAYREKFHGDVIIDLVGYRRYGHNEADEPAYTQPTLYAKIGEHPPVRQQWADALAREGLVAADEAKALWDSVYQTLVDAQAEVKGAPAEVHEEPEMGRIAPELNVETGVPRERLESFDRQLHAWPDGFTVNPKLVRMLEKRKNNLASGGALDWGHAEALAFASLLADGVPIRLTGQDAERGTFSHRHAVLHDLESDARYIPLGRLEEAKAPFEIHNSPLTEMATLGFEYGYSVEEPGALVLWEAQFGDFANGAQVIIDQFVVAGRAKWGQECRLVLLLPHGYEGQGPEHSSARLERFLQLAGEGSIRVANCTTPAQYFHLLRLQAVADEPRPLVVMTPKSLLRHPRAVATAEELVNGSFRPVLEEPGEVDRARVRRVILCTGKIYYDLIASEERKAARATTVLRVEQLYPFPDATLREAFASFEQLEEVVWVQEEPANMGAWRFAEARLRRLVPDGIRLGYAGRPERASPAEGFAHVHEQRQSAIVSAAWDENGAAAPKSHAAAEKSGAKKSAAKKATAKKTAPRRKRS